MSGAILLLSGPSGAGKSTIIRQASEHISPYYFSISSTTRDPRAGEQNGVEYFFVSKKEFEEGIEAGEFLEYAQVHDNYYGTSLKPVREALERDELVIFDIDVQGHRLARQIMGEYITSAFVTPPSLSELERRLRDRSTESDDSIKKRLQNAREEIQAIGEFDYVIINDDISQATKSLITLAKAARLKLGGKETNEFIHSWLDQ
jgi:guanylate kinase